jgi:Caspase domain
MSDMRKNIIIIFMAVLFCSGQAFACSHPKHAYCHLSVLYQNDTTVVKPETKIKNTTIVKPKINNKDVNVVKPKINNKDVNVVKPKINNKNANLIKPASKESFQHNYEPARKWAVIIGISTYQQSDNYGLTDLVFADDDAKAFFQSLLNLGWSKSHIKLLINKKATKRVIEIALESWLTKAGPNDQIILFWAGHGFPDPEDPEKVYFACYDTLLEIPVTGYRMDRIRSILEERNTKNVIVFADTCHAGKLITRGDRKISILPNIEKMRRDKNIPKGWIFMVAADTDRQAIEHTSWSNGAFTHSLIKGLSGKADGFQSAGERDGTITMGELKDYMNTVMPDETQKVLGVAKRPVITTSTGDPDIWNLTLQVKY